MLLGRGFGLKEISGFAAPLETQNEQALVTKDVENPVGYCPSPEFPPNFAQAHIKFL
jgi:hypothetical protein